RAQPGRVAPAAAARCAGAARRVRRARASLQLPASRRGGAEGPARPCGPRPEARSSERALRPDRRVPARAAVRGTLTMGRRLLDAWRRYWFSPASLTNLGIARVLVATILLWLDGTTRFSRRRRHAIRLLDADRAAARAGNRPAVAPAAPVVVVRERGP